MATLFPLFSIVMNDLTHEINDSNYIIFHDKDSEGVVIQNIVLSAFDKKFRDICFFGPKITNVLTQKLKTHPGIKYSISGERI